MNGRPVDPRLLDFLREKIRQASDLTVAIAMARQAGYSDAAISDGIELVRPIGNSLVQGRIPAPPLVRRAPPNLRNIGAPGFDLYALDGFLKPKDCARLIALIRHNLQPSTLSHGDDPEFRISQSALLCFLKSPVADETMGVKIAPAGVFNCADGAIFLAGGRQHHFEALCGVLGCAELREDPRFRTALTRYENRDALRAVLIARMKTWNAQALEDALGAAQVPAGVINDVARAFADPQVKHRGMAVPTPHPESPDLHTVASALRFSRTPVAYRLPPPLLGQHTRDILAQELGMDDAAIDALRAAGAI